jgi:tetratricopeptide (TPR) repeat protein
MSGAPDPVGTLEVALAHAESLLATDPARAAEQAAEILAAVPGHPLATFFLGIARRFTGEVTGSLEALEPLARSQPGWAAAHYELGESLAVAGRHAQAVAALRRAVELQPALPGAWCSLARALRALGDEAGADAVCTQRIQLSTRDPRLLEAGAALAENRVPQAEVLLRQQLQEDPTDVAAIRMLAEVALRLGENVDAGNLLARCLELAPNFTVARYNYAIALHRQMRHAEALDEINRALAAEPRNPGFRNMQAVLLGRIGEFDRAIEVYASVLAEYPQQPKTWMSYGHTLKAAGRQADSIDAYRKCIELRPELGEAWWSLANLKTFAFAADEIDMMRRQLGRADLSDEDRLHFEFTLGRALEDAGDYEGSFAHYAEGNRLRCVNVRYDPSEVTSHVRRSKALLTPSFFASRSGYGSPAPDPIFIVGLPRSGSTLLEQILSSHSAVEGTMELPDVISIVRDLTERGAQAGNQKYPEILASLEPGEFRALGERYLASTRIQRKTGRPMFIDKMPNNFAHVGLIHLMLPNARIIDARRHPLGCCFSNFKQHFARGQRFTYGLDDIGRYYHDYVELMTHFDAALPGRIHRVIYEQLVDDPETEIRRLLDYCGLPFEDACLRFHENERPVRTASSEQVRQPIFREGVDHWRHFEPWLGPLKAALGPVLDSYPTPPSEFGRQPDT